MNSWSTEFFSDADINWIDDTQDKTIFTLTKVGEHAEVLIQGYNAYDDHNLTFTARGYGDMYESRENFQRLQYNTFGSGDWSDLMLSGSFYGINIPYNTVADGTFFYSDLHTTSLTCQNTVWRVGKSAFRDLTPDKLGSPIDITMGDINGHEATVDNRGFQRCYITEIPGIIKHLGGVSQFENASRLTRVELDTNVILAENTFSSCIRLFRFNRKIINGREYINIITKENMTRVNDGVFNRCHELTEFYIHGDIPFSRFTDSYHCFSCDNTVDTIVYCNNAAARSYNWLSAWNRRVDFYDEPEDAPSDDEFLCIYSQQLGDWVKVPVTDATGTNRVYVYDNLHNKYKGCNISSGSGQGIYIKKNGSMYKLGD